MYTQKQSLSYCLHKTCKIKQCIQKTQSGLSVVRHDGDVENDLSFSRIPKRGYVLHTKSIQG